jgi:archaemetzincin
VLIAVVLNRLLLFLSVFSLSASCVLPVKKPSDRNVTLMGFSDFDSSLLKFLSNEVDAFYGCKVSTEMADQLPPSAFLTPRKRYKADSLLQFLAKRKPAGTNHILGLTGSDISVRLHRNSDWGVFGYGQCPGPAAVVSTYRLRRHPQHETGFRTRLKNVVLHELGHNFGLPHCPDQYCLMKDAKGKLSSVEGDKRTLCASCQLKIQ